MGPAPRTSATSPGHPDRERLHHRPLGKADVVGQFESESLGMHDRGAQTAMHRRSGPESDRGIKIVHAEARRATVRIRHARFHADPVAGLEGGDSGTGLDDGAGRLMAQHHRLTHDEGANGAVQEIMYIAPAHPDGVDANADVVFAQPLVEHHIPQGERLGFLENEGFHAEIKPRGVRLYQINFGGGRGRCAEGDRAWPG